MEDSIIINLILKALNTILSSIFSSIDNAIYPVLDELVFIDESIFDYTFLEKIVGESSNSGLLLLANSLLIAFVLYYIIRLMFSYYTGTETENPLHFLIRLVLFSLLMNSSLIILKGTIIFTNYITEYIRELGKSLFNVDISFLSFSNVLNNNLLSKNSEFNFISIDGIIKILMSIGIFNILISYSYRFVMLKILILISPFSFLCLINKNTSFLFKTWLQSFASLLLLQIIIVIILILPYAINEEIISTHSTLFNKLILIGTIYALFKANTFVKELFGGINTNINSSLATIKGLFTKA